MNERFARASAVARIDLAHEPDLLLGQLGVHPALREIVFDGRRETVDRRVMQVLVALARAHGGVVSRNDLIESCWDGVVVGEDAINACISRLRKMAEASGNAIAIETIPRVGYRLKIREISASEAKPPTASAAAQRPIYRGLQSLDEEDAAIFFGREAPIEQGLDTLHRVRNGSAKSILVILGASGAGKSSFLKAGLLARLKKDEENFLVLPVIRPERAALTGTRGLAASLVGDPAGLNGPHDFARLFASLREPVVERLRRKATTAGQSYSARPPTIVIPLDQAEELFAAENTEAGPVFERLAEIVRADRDIIIIATIRSDAFEILQNERSFSDIGLLPFSLARLPHGAFKDVIEGPARLASPPLAIEPALTERLLEDLATSDALPLLAFTLERLWLRHRGGGTLTIAEYADDLGGLRGAIKTAVDVAFAEAQRDPALPRERVELEKLARGALIPSLVQLDDADGEPRCRVERLNALPKATFPIVRHLVDQRLLVSDRGIVDGIATGTIEIAHEAILRQWPALRSWIGEERDALRALDGVRNAAREWQAHRSSGDHGESWLVHGSGRLEEVEQLLEPAHFSAALQPCERDYLQACRARDDADRERERSEIEREKKAITRTRRLQRNIFVLIGAGVIIASGAGWVAYEQRGEALDAREQIAQGETRLLTEVAAERFRDGDIPGAQRMVVEVLAHLQATPLDRVAAVNVFQDIRAGDRQLALFERADALNWADWSPDGRRIVTASKNDKTARIWDAFTGVQLAIMSGHSDTVNSVVYSHDGQRIVTASDDNTARIWDAATGLELSVLHGHSAPVNYAVFSPDGRRIVTASTDKTARIWNAVTGTQLSVAYGHNDTIGFATFSPDGRRIVTASNDKTARIWDAATGTLIGVLSSHSNQVITAAFSPDGRRIVTASQDKTARLWDAASGAQLAVLSGHKGSVNDAEFSPDGRTIVTASADKTARLWDAAAGTQLAVLTGHSDGIFSAAFSPDGRRILTASNDKTVRIWNAVTSPQLMIFTPPADNVRAAGFSPDGRRVVTGSSDKAARIWDAKTGALLATLSGHEASVVSATFSPDGRRLVTTSPDKTARVWDVATGAQLSVLRGHGDIVSSAAFSPDGRRIVTASYDKTARIWDASNYAQSALLSGHQGRVFDAQFSPDGRRIVTASRDKTVRIWDAATGAQLAVFYGHAGPVYSAAFSPDGRRIVTGSNDNTARIWDAATGAQLSILSGHASFVGRAEFSPDGADIVTASGDGTVRLWDSNRGLQLAVLQGHNDAVYSAAFSRDGSRIVTASADKTARIWNARLPADLDRQVIWEEAAEFEPLTDTERPQLGLPPDPRVRIWNNGASKCDSAAAAPYDPDRRASGVSQDGVAADVAISACATLALPRSPRSDYQLGRALLSKGDVRGAARKFEAAASAGYRVAGVDLANLLVDRSARMLDPVRAVSLYEKAWQDGVTIAAFELGQVYEHGVHGAGAASHVELQPNLGKAWFWYRRGEAAGEPNALARFGEKGDSDAAADSKKRNEILLTAFRYYAAAAERAYHDDWPDDAWKDWRYRRATLARMLAREGMMQQVADAYTTVRQRWQPHQPTLIERLRSWLP